MTPAIYPVIHYQNLEQGMRNAERIAQARCDGLFLIQMEGKNEQLINVGLKIKGRFPDLKIGINHLGASPGPSVLYNANYGIDMTWTDVQLTHSNEDHREKNEEIQEILTRHKHELFCGVAFKYQRPEPDPIGAAQRAIKLGYIPTTSGKATGKAADHFDIVTMRQGLGATAPLAIASGITPENYEDYADYLTHILVATGVSKNFHELDEEKLAAIVKKRAANTRI